VAGPADAGGPGEVLMLAVKAPFGARRQDAATSSSRRSLVRHAFDQDYVRRLTAGDPDTEEHFTRYFGDLLTLKLRGRLRSAALIEDARQETFVRVLSTLRRKGGLDTAESLGAFVNSVCNNVLFEAYRSESRLMALPPDAPEPADAAESVESRLASEDERERVRRVIADLPEKDKDLLRWVFFEERDKDDICRELKIDREYLRVLLHRTKRRFKAEFGSVESGVSVARTR
jgi:RNA polymerase sigma-70 factor, ECF subfamily